ncbi:hypothetical protein MTR67_030937 [Solanum verrucosum]|uniref:DUF4216 domain-containing protein n=1 Tax=Solanum verrucosum TaxID=315347 RepID=A0AAF0U1I2_SOLVR|nr:hypothetical protein MTR67_030937 [Solanum verrucosum]
MVVSKTESYASSSDNAPKSANISYYGKLNDIMELKYYEEFKVVVFKCDWVDVTKGRGIMEDDVGFTVVNFSRLADPGNRYCHKPFIFAEQAQQVIFVQGPHDHEWFFPRLIKPRDIFDMGEENSMQLKSSMNSYSTDLAILENSHVPEYENNDWVRSGVNGIIIDMEVHTQASL